MSDNILEMLMENFPLAGVIAIVGWALLKRSDKMLREVLESHREDINKQNERYLDLMEKTITLLERHDNLLKEQGAKIDRVNVKLEKGHCFNISK